jgi:hypothetical protein
MKLAIKLAAITAVIALPLAIASARAQGIEFGPRGPRVEFGEHHRDWQRHREWRDRDDWRRHREWQRRHHYRDYDED